MVQESNGLRTLQFQSLQAERVPHAAFTRHGGASDPPFHSLNLSKVVGDDPEAVEANRAHVQDAFPVGGRELIEVRQVHGAHVAEAQATARRRPYSIADGLITNRSDLVLTMRFADCLPILAFDPRERAIGLAHAGWKGTGSGVARSLVDSMQSAYGSQPSDLLVALGPAICAAHYPVGSEVREAVVSRQGAEAAADFSEVEGQLHFDLVRANLRQLRLAGVTHIENCGVCTACQVQDWYSHRAEGGRTGRFGVYLALPADPG